MGRSFGFVTDNRISYPAALSRLTWIGFQEDRAPDTASEKNAAVGGTVNRAMIAAMKPHFSAGLSFLNAF
jgi:hypothetical protein